jgi:hypothetical protein
MDLQGMPGGVEDRRDAMSLLLMHMRPMDAFLIVVRNFEDPALGAPNPARDFRNLEDEFLIADMGTVEKRIEKLNLEAKRGKKLPEKEMAILQACAAMLNEGKPLRLDPDLAAAPELRGFTFLSAKPIHVRFGDAEALVIRGKLEMEISQLSASEAEAFREDFGIAEAARDRVIQKSFALLKLATFLTVGEDEVKAWTIPDRIPAAEAAGSVHSDIQKGFIRAEVVAFEDLKKAGDYATARKQGSVRLEGKTYPVRDGDIINFRFNV